MSSQSNSPTVCIVYGFAEGPAMGRRLRLALEQAGFETVSNPARADIILAHSGGCFVLPEKHQAKLVILIGPPHWPGKSLLMAIAQKAWLDMRAHRQGRKLAGWLKKAGWNLVYGANIRRNMDMQRGRKQGSLWQTNAARVVMVRNHQDTFCTPKVHSLPFKTPPIIVEMIGQHDDCWIAPQKYVDIVQLHHGA
jgi:hypothetical protein